jgi:hypothetical protein
VASIFATCERLQTNDGHTEWTKPISQLQITSNMLGHFLVTAQTELMHLLEAQSGRY